jgi:hypothetical protein
MARFVVFLLLVAAVLSPVSALARNGGIYLELAPSWGFYLTDEVIIEDGDDAGSPYPQGGFTPTLKLGVNLFGFIGGELQVAAHAWDLGSVERGGGGYVGGVVRATPLELLTFVMPPDLMLPSLIPVGPVSWRDRPFDIGVSVGGGYTLVGEDYAYQGGFFQWGVDLKVWLTPNFAVGLDLPVRHMLYEPFRYSDYANGKGFCTDGASAFGSGGISVSPTPNRATYQPYELDAATEMNQCTGAAPAAVLFSPSLTITGNFDFGI